jgi:hypothetical protein
MGTLARVIMKDGKVVEMLPLFMDGLDDKLSHVVKAGSCHLVDASSFLY